MATALTLAQLRDDVRRKMQIVPPIDTGAGNAGDLPPGQPDPGQTTVNNAINEGIDAVNRAVRIGKLTDAQVSVSAAVPTKRGPLYVDVSGVLPAPLVVGEIEEIWWTDGAGNTFRVEPYTYHGRDRQYQAFPQLAPGRPTHFILSGHQVGLLPPPASAGTLSLTFAGGIPPLLNDTDTIAYLPVEYQAVVQYWAVTLLSGRMAQDLEAQARAAFFGAKAAEGTLQIYAWKNGYDNNAIQSVRDVLMVMPMAETMRLMQMSSALQGAGQGQGPGGSADVSAPPPPGTI